MNYIDEYLKDCKARLLSPISIAIYQRDLRKFKTFLARKKKKTLEEATEEDLYDLFDAMNTNNYWTRAGLLRTVKAFYRWMERRGIIVRNPFREITLRRPPLPFFRPLQEKEIERIVRSLESGQFKYKTRDKVIFYTLLSSGVRIGELMSLYKSQVDLNKRMIRLPPSMVKGRRKGRIVPISKKAAFYIKKLIAEDKTDSPLLIHTRTGRRMDRTQATRIVAKIVRRAIPEREDTVTAHLLRKTFITRWIEGGGNIKLLKDIAGWTTLKQLDVYVSLSEGYIQKEIQRMEKKLGGPE